MKLYNSDLFNVLPQLIEEGTVVDMVLVDPPYGVLNKKNKSSQWDNRLDFDKLWPLIWRIVKPNGAVVITSQGILTAQLMLSSKKEWRYNMIWNKVRKTGFLNAKKMPLRQHEDVLVFYKNTPTYNPQMEKSKPHQRNHNSRNSNNKTNNCYGTQKNVLSFITDEKYPTSIIQIIKELNSGCFYHPTQKPVALMEYLIKTYTNEGETVLDFCMGSGSTGVACVNTNRDFIGIELDPNFYNIAKRRIFYEKD